ncbi:MAG TPA: BtpA/SgcQ family protein, partial [Candidatus Nanoarchaeia archaeon]|nr:BtpA/SgcQ family protein [Candidatus Nanoarchaeia archaeon]
RQYKSLLGQFPLIVGAGVTASNAYEQLSIADGAIVGSYFKSEGDTQSPVKRHKVRELMKIVRQLR